MIYSSDKFTSIISQDDEAIISRLLGMTMIPGPHVKMVLLCQDIEESSNNSINNIDFV